MSEQRSALTWTYRELPDDELVWYTTLPCECKASAESGTRNGYTCSAHRAQAEIDRRYPRGGGPVAAHARTERRRER